MCRYEGAAMREYELEVLEQYDVEVISTRKIRGAFFCETNKGTMVLKADVSKREEVKNMINYVIKEYGKIDVLINNAGISGNAGVF